MRARLLAVAAFLAAAVGGGLFFVNWDSGAASTIADLPGGFEAYDRSKCSIAPCNAPACQQARNILADAGSADTLHLVECPVRVGVVARAVLADGGTILSASPYQQIRFIAMRDPGTGAVAVPVDDAGWPQFAVAVGTPGCRKRPAGTSLALCSRVDGGDQGDENQAPAAELTGGGCVGVPCGVIAGDEPP
jgi:hypothetical protein